MSELILKPGREKAVRQKHPWIFSGAVERVKGSPGSGETVDVVNSNGEFLGRAAYSPSSQIRARMWTRMQEEVNVTFLQKRILQAVSLREDLVSPEESNAYRLVNAESDGIPGVIVDRYDRFLILQCLTAGAEFWRRDLTNALTEITGCGDIYERSDVEVRSLEGLPQRVGVLCGKEPPDHIEIFEGNSRFLVDVRRGHKTGFYLDQRRNRLRVGELARSRSLLNCFCYTGAFTIHALLGGAKETLSIDSSSEVLSLAAENLRLNGHGPDRSELKVGDVFEELRLLRDRNQKFDAIILDPPKFAQTQSQAERASHGYKDINLLAFKLLRPGGLLFTFSCSGGVSADLFEKIVAGAALDAGVDARVVERLTQGIDHPVALNFPEGAYLKGLIVRIQG